MWNPFKVHNKDTRGTHRYHFGVFTVNFEPISLKHSWNRKSISSLHFCMKDKASVNYCTKCLPFFITSYVKMLSSILSSFLIVYLQVSDQTRLRDTHIHEHAHIHAQLSCYTSSIKTQQTNTGSKSTSKILVKMC